MEKFLTLKEVVRDLVMIQFLYQKAIIKLAESFTTIGHVVRVFNNCEESVVINGVSWKSIKNMDAAHSDVWIANNNPLLFNLIDFLVILPLSEPNTLKNSI